jgi:hypothetical protein
MGRFIIKHINTTTKPQVKVSHGTSTAATASPSKPLVEKNENKKIREKRKVMTTDEKIALANEVLDQPRVKRIKKDRGLIERTESSKTIITEDNKELLND